jgi:hypothetical protein
MENLESEIKEAAKHILNFFKQSYPIKFCGEDRTWIDRLKTLKGWIKKDEWDEYIEKCGGGLYEEKLRAQRLREIYQEGDLEKIAGYGRDNINTMTGGMKGGPDLWSWGESFHNETTLNHLNQFDPEYIGNPYGDYARKSQEITPFYKKLIEEAKDIETKAIEIRKDITSQEFIERVKEATKEARKISYIISEIAKPAKELYLLEEFKRKEEVIPLLKRVEELYSSTIDLTKAIIELADSTT